MGRLFKIASHRAPFLFFQLNEKKKSKHAFFFPKKKKNDVMIFEKKKSDTLLAVKKIEKTQLCSKIQPLERNGRLQPEIANHHTPSNKKLILFDRERDPHEYSKELKHNQAETIISRYSPLHMSSKRTYAPKKKKQKWRD